MLVRSTPFIFFLIPYIIIPWYAIDFALMSCFDHADVSRKMFFLSRECLWLYPSLSALHPGVYGVLSPIVPFLPPSAVV